MKKLIVITSPYFFKGEDSILSHLFDEGMPILFVFIYGYYRKNEFCKYK